MHPFIIPTYTCPITHPLMHSLTPPPASESSLFQMQKMLEKLMAGMEDMKSSRGAGAGDSHRASASHSPREEEGDPDGEEGVAGGEEGGDEDDKALMADEDQDQDDQGVDGAEGGEEGQEDDEEELDENGDRRVRIKNLNQFKKSHSQVHKKGSIHADTVAVLEAERELAVVSAAHADALAALDEEDAVRDALAESKLQAMDEAITAMEAEAPPVKDDQQILQQISDQEKGRLEAIIELERKMLMESLSTPDPVATAEDSDDDEAARIRRDEEVALLRIHIYLPP